jgi:predicted MPP superfamily phosphohydrolase
MKKLSLYPNGTFKIVQFSDLHLQDGGVQDQKTLSLMGQILDEEKPELAIITGDIIRAEKSLQPVKAFMEVGCKVHES